MELKSADLSLINEPQTMVAATPLNKNLRLQETFGRVYAVKHSETICAAKEFCTTRTLTRQVVEQILRSYSKLRHPNVIQFLGVFYNQSSKGLRLPVIVMEMMADSLTSLIDKHQTIPVKFSIIHDVSLGLCYFHSHDPPIIHGELFPHKVLLIAQHVAKISFGVTGKLRDSQNRISVVTPANLEFMPPEVLANNFVYRPSTDIFSFAGIVLYTVNQQ
ncbi:serine/threonine-protein kinase TNNI3K-like [Dysidea avara]|uniref:serine/threonine-protein kinase TNNI3K-like n=1 Tax=Dysidea avara TaxID=196820 RepID=UPI00332F170B